VSGLWRHHALGGRPVAVGNSGTVARRDDRSDGAGDAGASAAGREQPASAFRLQPM